VGIGQPRKKLEPSAERLLGLLHRWRDEAVKEERVARTLGQCARFRRLQGKEPTDR
jgi:hypothetical protein